MYLASSFTTCSIASIDLGIPETRAQYFHVVMVMHSLISHILLVAPTVCEIYGTRQIQVPVPYL